MKKVLVTGGAGFVGLNIANFLADKNYRVLAIDIAPKPTLLSKKVKFIKADICSRKIGSYLKGVETVFHTAALIKFEESIKDPAKYHNVNVNGTLNLLIRAIQSGVRRIIYSSSSSVYGSARQVPQTEEMLPGPQSPYAAQKLFGEIYMKVWSDCYDIETVSLRYFNFYGPNNGKLSGVIDTFLRRHKENKPLTIYGTGRQKRSFLHIDDLVSANYKAMLSNKVGKGEVINIGLDKSYSIKEVAKMVGGKVIHASIPNKTEDFQPYESLPAIKKAKKLLKWQPRIYLEEGIKLIKAKIEDK
ncbi:hypothetical protein A2V71_03630 [Candidatus Berkelbacteria bacterium RBG_13_40_8]|uniref:NAD-dependent epimerase/dehydratase domain-containing protein n=1 Tax=Candidatus Berkelbacteria bacterium RBG_13_40_8 TaxID=1797467 RepID=A0A1F5DNN9_9BACT|nr:MAG: hypothetical protein A2V71_03630 [Candidatus Berkelbacteria bacterium RBG_13_40_8]